MQLSIRFKANIKLCLILLHMVLRHCSLLQALILLYDFFYYLANNMDLISKMCLGIVVVICLAGYMAMAWKFLTIIVSEFVKLL